mmetsp:Transcript_6529/g.9844  ORF Transcript_6529/g.9844 Transcript_6529/m.9844 type:complete len:198 (+) Transcript_6529:389-982(+)
MSPDAQVKRYDSLLDAAVEGRKNSALFQTVMSHLVSSNTGEFRPGMDFRSANEYAGKVGAEIVLGDIPLNITLQRAWDMLKIGEKLKLGSIMVKLAMGSGAETEKSEDFLGMAKDGRVEEEMLDSLIAELTAEFPSLVGPLLHERNKYLAWSLKRSRAVSNKDAVVGVVGRAHVAGIIEEIKNDNGGDKLIFKDLIK